VEGAGVHHNPTPGPADGEWLYGHNWVALAWLAVHPVWGVIALPLRSMLYVRAINVPKLSDKYHWEFRTKHQLGIELLTWFITTLKKLGVKTKVWLAVDGFYAARPFLLPALKLGIVVVSRLRRDACLFDLPAEGSHGNRIYGENKISLAKRAGRRQGWSTISYLCRGVRVTGQYKTFLATSRLISGAIRVVIVRFEPRRLGALLLHGHVGESRRYSGNGGGALGDRRTFPRCERSMGSRSATSSQCMVEHRMLEFEPMDGYIGRAMLLGRGQIKVE